MDELSSLKIICKRQRFIWSPVQTKPEASSLRSMLQCQTSCMLLDAWLLTLCGVQRHHSQTLRFHILFVVDRINYENFLIEFEASIRVILHVIQQTCALLQTFLNYYCTQQGFPGTSQSYSSHLFDCPGNIGGWSFLLLCQSCHFLVWVIFKGLFDDFFDLCLPNWEWSSRESEAFKRCYSVFLKFARNKVNISIF